MAVTTRRSHRIEDGFESVFEHLGVSVALFDLQGRLVRCNRAYADMLGYRKPELAGRTVLALTHPSDRRRNRALLEKLLAEPGRSQYTFDKRYLHRDGGPVPVQANASLLRSPDGSPRYILGMAVDLTHKREAELARLESAEKSRFLSAMSHEIRTPLNAMLGFAELLEIQLAPSLSDKHRQYLANIRSSGKHLLALVNDFLDLSRAQAGRMPLLAEPVDVGSLVQECAREMRGLASNKGVDLLVSHIPSITIETDERRLKQVVLNLLSNAIKFTNEGTVRVGIDVIEGEVRIWVKDTGIGISDEDRKHVFGEFRQAKHRSLADQEGTGLGLALCRQLMDLLGGRIDLESELGAGSTFTVIFPSPAPL